MIKKIWLHNYGPFEHAEFELEPLTVIVGPNASGKSIALKALDRLDRSDPGRFRIALESMKRKGAEADAVEVGVFYSLANQKLSSSWSSHANGPRDATPSTVLLQLRPDRLREPSYLSAEIPQLEADGYGLASVLEDMKLRDSESFESVLNQTRSIVPTLADLRLRRARVKHEDGPRIGQELILDMKNAPDLRPDAASDGTLLVLGLLTLLISVLRREGAESRPALFLIDELERSLHPKALGELVSHLRRLTQEFEIQILATSHSPYLVDWLRPEEVRITSWLDDGSATIRELGDHPEFERWKDEMKPGEFWSTVGEDWSE